MVVSVLVLLKILYLCSASPVQLSVGIYNEIPDLNTDGLASYKQMIETGFQSDAHEVNAVVNKQEYDPYGDLVTYLSADGFDLIEMDMANLQQVVDQDLIIVIPTPFPKGILPAAVSAVRIGDSVYAYPTLVCGNFIIQLTPDYKRCNLRVARANYYTFYGVMETCKTVDVWDRMLGGKMNDKYGWYLPFIYIDGYIDIYGPDSVPNAMEELAVGIVDETLCERLSWLIGLCNHGVKGKNKCYDDFPGSYVNSSSNVYPDVEQGKSYMYFGFSEKVAQIERDSERNAHVAISGPLGEQNILLQFTDALVINKARWNKANENKRNAIMEFVQYFLSDSLREKIAMGEDLHPPRPRYLLQATENFYENTNNPIYMDLFWSLQTAVAAPSPNDELKLLMQATLTKSCVDIPKSESARKTEL